MMNAATWKRIVAPFIDDKWRVRNNLAYLRPVGWTLHGILGEGSPSKEGFYLWIVRIPLFVPTKVINLNWSERFGGGSTTYELNSDTTTSALETAMNVALGEAADARLVPDPPGGADNVGMQEARAYGLFVAGDGEAAMEVLDRVLRYEPRHDWERERADRAAGLRRLIELGRSSEAIGRLEAWRLESLGALRIDPD
jgi:hypothetical protein